MSNEISEVAMSNEAEQKITLITADKKTFVVELSIAKQMETLETFFSDEDANVSDIPLQNVNSRELLKIIEYLQRPDGDEEVENSVKELSPNEIMELLVAANYLNVKSLMEFIFVTIADSIKDKSVEYVREYFGIENDFSKDEEEQLRKENAWAFEGVN